MFEKMKQRKEEKNRDLDFKKYPHLLAIKPKEHYIFHSDYFEIDGEVATIMSFFHIEGAQDDFGPFWGVNRIPSGLGNDITTICFEQVRRMTKSWVDTHQSQAEGISNMNANENNRGGTSTARNKAFKKQNDLTDISKELTDGASYLNCHYRIMVKAPTLDKLDEALTSIERLYVERFATLSAASYMGEQKKELSTLFLNNDKKEGKGFYFTSTEFAGSYSLVTHGLEDANGEYVGYMTGDVNNAAVLFAVNEYDHHVVIANENYDETQARTPLADYWGSKISQSCMLHNGRVVHIILDECNLNNIGPKFKKLTYRVDMNKGDMNMFEMFGDTEDELSIFPMQMQKLILMAEQAYETTESDRSVIRSSLEEIATQFYIDNRMWYENAAENRHKLRVTGIPHKEVPKLEMFCAYLNTERAKALASDVQDTERNHALTILKATFNNMLSNNGDLFNITTSNVIDGAKTGRRVIYDFSQLRRRGEGIAMAQLVNVIGFAVGNLGLGDTVVFHGTEKIADRVKDYIMAQLDVLYAKGGRVCFLYNNFDKVIKDKSFSRFDRADYTIFGPISNTQVTDYQESLGQKIPPDLVKLITLKSPDMAYIRRGFMNVVFHQDLALGIEKKKGVRI